eukprot:scaffold21265_cov131-Isochrysis_galbana.AAC.6
MQHFRVFGLPDAPTANRPLTKTKLLTRARAVVCRVPHKSACICAYAAPISYPLTAAPASVRTTATTHDTRGRAASRVVVLRSPSARSQLLNQALKHSSFPADDTRRPPCRLPVLASVLPPARRELCLMVCGLQYIALSFKSRQPGISELRHKPHKGGYPRHLEEHAC